MTGAEHGGRDLPAGVHSEIVENSLPRHWNACGLAAVASVLARLRAGAWAAEAPPDVTSELDRLIARFPPDMPFGLGTTSFRIAAALRAHGVEAEAAHGGFAARHAQSVFARARVVIDRSGIVANLVAHVVGRVPWGKNSGILGSLLGAMGLLLLHRVWAAQHGAKAPLVVPPNAS